MRLRLEEAAAQVDGTRHGEDVTFTGLSTDSRTIAPGELFVALRGPNFDGHRYVTAARARGAAGALLEQVSDELPCITVTDARAAMGVLAAAWRNRFDVDTAGITGSNGKTTVKEMTAAILAEDAPVLATRGNLNNDIGVPLTLARLDASHERLVVEMGANHVGEIAALAALARPRVGVITLIAPAHLEGFGSIERVARAKGEMIAGLPRDGVAVVNADDDTYLDLWRELADGRTLLRFGFSVDADVRVEHEAVPAGSSVTLFTPAGSIDATMRLPGRHNAANAAAAAAAALAMNVPLECIRAGLEKMRAVGGRLAVHRGTGGARLIDDSYNANPHSLAAALQVLEESPPPRWLVLGDMAELGDTAEDFHREAGRMARRAGVERLFTLGPMARLAAESFGSGAAHFDRREALIDALGDDLSETVTVLVKGSRSMGMESVVRSQLQGEAACS